MSLIHKVFTELKKRKPAILAIKMAAVLALPLAIYSYGTNPPLAHTGAPGQGTCSSCHGSLTAGSGVTVTLPSLTYTPGGAAVPLTVNIPATGGFQLTTLTQSGNSPTGTLTAGGPPPGAPFPQDAVSTSGGIQYVYSTVETTSWSFTWTPPATNVGNVVVYVAGGTHNSNYSNSYVLTPAGSQPPPSTNLAASPASLTFTVNGAAPATQSVQVTSSGASLAFTTVVSTISNGNWLTAIPAGGNTPLGVTVGILAAGLSAGTYQGSLALTAGGASNSPLSVPVIVNVVTPLPPSVPTLHLSSSQLTFSATVGGTATPQNVAVTTSDGSAAAFTATASTTTGGNWLSISPGAGATPGSEAVSISTTGLAAGTYRGNATFTSASVSNSPVTLPVTLTVSPSTPPPTNLPRFTLVVVDGQSGGTDWMLLNGGSSGTGNRATASGSYTRFRAPSGQTGGRNGTVVANGTWTVTEITSFTPATGEGSGGVLVLQVKIAPSGGTPSAGTMTISSTGSNAGVTLAIDGGSTFVPAGIGQVTLNARGVTGGGEGGGNDN